MVDNIEKEFINFFQSLIIIDKSIGELYELQDELKIAENKIESLQTQIAEYVNNNDISQNNHTTLFEIQDLLEKIRTRIDGKNRAVNNRLNDLTNSMMI